MVSLLTTLCSDLRRFSNSSGNCDVLVHANDAVWAIQSTKIPMKNPTAIASFESEDAAGRVARKLRDAGFDARVRGDSHNGLTSQGSGNGNGSGIYRVIVPAIHTARALSWCREFDAAESLLSQALRCPSCGSTRVNSRGADQSTSNQDGRGGRVFRCDACNSLWGGATVPEFPALTGTTVAA